MSDAPLIDGPVSGWYQVAFGALTGWCSGSDLALGVGE